MRLFVLKHQHWRKHPKNVPICGWGGERFMFSYDIYMSWNQPLVVGVVQSDIKIVSFVWIEFILFLFDAIPLFEWDTQLIFRYLNGQFLHNVISNALEYHNDTSRTANFPLNMTWIKAIKYTNFCSRYVNANRMASFIVFRPNHTLYAILLSFDAPLRKSYISGEVVSGGEGCEPNSTHVKSIWIMLFLVRFSRYDFISSFSQYFITIRK